MAPAACAAIFQTGPLAWNGADLLLAAQRRVRALRLRDVLRPAQCAAAPGRRGRRSPVEVRQRRPRPPAAPFAISTPPPASKRDVWLVFWIVPAFYTAFGIIFFMLTRTMPPPRPDMTTAQMVELLRPARHHHPDRVRRPGADRRRCRRRQRHRRLPHEAHDGRLGDGLRLHGCDGGRRAAGLPVGAPSASWPPPSGPTATRS